MAGILKILQSEEKKVTSGIVTASKGNNNYTVNIGGRSIHVRSAFTKKLSVGSKILLTNADEGNYIIGEDSVIKRGQVEIPVTG
jgi:hypothetical protein